MLKTHRMTALFHFIINAPTAIDAMLQLFPRQRQVCQELIVVRL
jgi:hypothetical protein